MVDFSYSTFSIKYAHILVINLDSQLRMHCRWDRFKSPPY